MADLDDRFRSLDDVRAPDVWDDAATRTPGRAAAPDRRRHVGGAVSVGALVVFVAVAALLARNLIGNEPEPPPNPAGTSPQPSVLAPHPGAQPRSLFGVDPAGSVRCSASLSSEVLEPGDTLSVVFGIENIGDRPLNYASGPGGEQGSIQLLGSERLVWDGIQADSQGRSVPPPIHRELAPGARTQLSSTSVVVRWPGPLEVVAICPLGIGALEPTPLNIIVPGPAPSAARAISAAVDATGGLYADCAPGPDGGDVVGTITPPSIAIDALPLPAVCWADLRVDDGLVDVALHFASPPEMGKVPVTGIRGFGPPGSGPVEAHMWEFVVTARGAYPVDLMFSASRNGPDLWSFEYSFDGRTWSTGDCTPPGTESFGNGVGFFFRNDPCH